MRAVVLRRPGLPVRVEEVELDPPEAGEVLVRVAAAGVCHSDLRLADGELGDGRWPMVLGHEGAGVVEAVGAGVTGLAPGDRVAFCFVPACRECPPCRAGKPNLCEPAGACGVAGTLMDGTSRLHAGGERLQHGLMTACFAERTVLAAAGAIPVPAGLPLWQAALLGCGVVTGAGAVRNVARLSPGQSACVIGCGGVGLQVLAAARRAGAEPLIAVDRGADKLEAALARGATAAVDGAAGDAASQIRALSGGGVDCAFEVVGTPKTIRLAWRALRPGGRAVVVGLVPRGVEVEIPGLDFLSDKSLLGSYYGSGDPAREIPELAALALAGELDLAGVVSQTTALDGVAEALERLRRGEGARTIVVVDRELAGVSA
jgi:Zn-dependent alcohol dehydrogenase